MFAYSDKNACEPNPCRNHGNCIDQVTGYTCQCTGGWKGKTCTLSKSTFVFKLNGARYLELTFALCFVNQIIINVCNFGMKEESLKCCSHK